MHILWVKAGKLLPVDTGGRIRSFNLLRQLVRRHTLTLLTYYGGPRDEGYERAIAEHFPGATTVNTADPERSGPAQVFRYLTHLALPAPYAVTKFAHAAVRRRVARWLVEERCDVAVCDFLSATSNFPSPLLTPSVLFQHNVESTLWRRQADIERHPLRRVVYQIEAAKMARYERAAVRRFDHVIAVSEHDRRLMAAMTDSSRISVVPTGVDRAQYGPTWGREATEPLVLFLGSMDWEPNIDAVEFFCRDIWPRVVAGAPQAHFRIVGRNPHRRVRRLASESVTVTGTVPSVLDDLAQAAVFVVPLRIGGGTRLKILEALAAGRAVVSTTVGAEGLDVHRDRDVLLADDSADFAAAVLLLLRDRERRRRLGAAGVELAALYDWSVIARRLEEVLARTAGDASADSPWTRRAAVTAGG